MTISFNCNTCGKKLKVADDSAGKKVRCPGCKEVNVAPAEDVPEAEADEEAAPRKPRQRAFREDGQWEVGDEVLAPCAPDCLNLGTIQELQEHKALIAFTHMSYTGWVFADTLQNVEAPLPDQRVKCFEKSGTIRDGKVVRVQGDTVRVVYGNNYGMGLPIDWTEEQAQFDLSAIGILCDPTSPGAKDQSELEFYENLHKGDRVWAPWERSCLFAGKVLEVNGHEVHVDFDNGNRGWVLLGQIFPYYVYVGEHVTVCKGSGYGATVSAVEGDRIQVTDDNGKNGWVAASKLMKNVLPTGPNARPTRFAGGLLLKLVCIPVGILLAALAVVGAIFSEDYHARQSQTIAEGASSCVSASADRVDPSHEGKLVHLTGEAKTDDTIGDQIFDFTVSSKALKLIRTVEIRQWVEKSETKKEKEGGKEVKVTHYSHTAEWVKAPINSDGFHEGTKTGKKPKNVFPEYLPPSNAVRAKVKCGAHQLTDAQIDRIGAGEKLLVPEEVVAKPPEKLKQKVKVLNGIIYICMYADTDPTNPNVGDLRITYSEVKPTPITVVARQTGSTFALWVSSTGTNTLDDLRPGAFTKDEMFEKAAAANERVQLVLRIGCGVILAVALYVLLAHWWLWRIMIRKKTI